MASFIKKIFIISSLFISSTFHISAEAKPVEVCQSFIKNKTDIMLQIFHNTKLTESEKRRDLAVLFQESVDTDWIGKYILGHSWKNATEAEQKQYLKSYREYITHTYVSKYNDEDTKDIYDIKISSVIPTQQNEFLASTLIKVKDDDDIKIDYVLAQSADKCQVHDINIEGVSLILTQRSEFSAAAGFSGINGVIKSMEKQYKMITSSR